MKLWHERLIPHLPDGILKRLHSDCCNMRKGFGKKTKREMKYVFDGGILFLAVYHTLVLEEMEKRGMNSDFRLTSWKIHNYHGRHLGYSSPFDKEFVDALNACKNRGNVYAAHNDAMLVRGIQELRRYGVSLPELELEAAARGNI